MRVGVMAIRTSQNWKVNANLLFFTFMISTVSYFFRQGYKQLANIVFAVTILTLVFCTISVYRLNYLLSSLIAIIVLHQLLAPNKDNNMSAQAERNEEFNNVGNVFEQIKAKWE